MPCLRSAWDLIEARGCRSSNRAPALSARTNGGPRGSGSYEDREILPPTQMYIGAWHIVLRRCLARGWRYRKHYAAVDVATPRALRRRRLLEHGACLLGRQIRPPLCWWRLLSSTSCVPPLMRASSRRTGASPDPPHKKITRQFEGAPARIALADLVIQNSGKVPELLQSIPSPSITAGLAITPSQV